MDPAGERPRMYTQVVDYDLSSWDDVRRQLENAGTYWVIGRGAGHPHPRPVWGVWVDDSLRLSLGSPVLRRELESDPTVTVHLDSGTDVVIVEGSASEVGGDDVAPSLAAYDRKYDWKYDADQYGPLTLVRPTTVFAWKAAGPAGRDGFTQAARWRFS
jgi:hypothetical protein